MEEEKEEEVITEEKPQYTSTEPEKGGKGLATASMVLGLVGLLVAALPCGILAIIFSVVSKKKIKSGMATAGLVLGIIDLVGWALFMLLWGGTLFNM